MMKKMKKLLVLCAAAMVVFTGCGEKKEESASNKSVENATLNIAYQYGLGHVPAVIAKEKGFIEEAYKDATGKELTINWNQMSSGADINTGIASGSLQAGFMGAGPAISGVTKDVGYKIFTNITNQEHCLMTNDESITSLGDLIGSEHQIALVNIGSIQHIILAKALYNAGYDPHALDSNLVAMAHPDGMSALESGSVACHLTSSPYIYMERANKDLHEIQEITEALTVDNTFNVGVASEELYNNNKELYQALCDGVQAAIDYINNNMEEVAKLTYELDGNSLEDELEYLQKGRYTAETSGIFELAVFMADNDFIDKKPESYSDLVFDNVTGD